MNEMTQVLGTVAMDPKGEYNPTTYYEKLNVVTCGDFTYMAKESVMGEHPSSSNKWLCIGGVVDNAVSTVADISSMKSATNLVSGMVAKTLGYYSVNDGGGASYVIVDDNTLTDDGGYIHELSNGLFAVMLIENDTINFKQLGAKRYNEDNTFDNKAIMDKYIAICNLLNKRLKLIIPGGKWCFSATLINRPKGVWIEGDKSWAYDGMYGSAILPLNDNQQYIWKLGGLADYTDYDTSISVSQMVRNAYIDGIWFTTMNGADDTRYSVSQGTFIIDRCDFCVFDNIYLWKIKGNGLVITSSWELDFGILSIRQHSNPETYSILFDRTKPIGNVSCNISALTIEKLYFERNDNYIKSMPGSGFSHNHIGYINAEVKFSSVGTIWDTDDATPEEIAAATQVHIFRGISRYLTIGTMNITFNNSDNGIVYNNQKYYMKSVICDDYSLIDGISSRDRQFNVTVGILSLHYGTSGSLMSVIKSVNMAQISHINIGTLNCEEEKPKILVDAYQSGNIRIGNFSSNGNAYNTSDIVTDFEPAYKHTVTGNSHGNVTYMESAPSEYNLVSYKEGETAGTGIRFKYYGFSDSINTQTLKVLCKNMTENDMTFKVRFVQNGNDNDITSPTLPADGEWHILSITFWADYGSTISWLDYGNRAYAGFKID